MPIPAPHRAARAGDVTALEALLPFDVDARTVCGWTPLCEAAWAGHAPAVRALLDAGARPDAGALDGLTPLTLAAGQGHKGCVAALLERGADPDAIAASGRTPVESALQGLHLAVARQLVDAGAHLDGGAALLWLRAAAGVEGRRCKLQPDRHAPTGRWSWVCDGPLTGLDGDTGRLAPALDAPLASGPVHLAMLSNRVRFASAPRAFRQGERGHMLPTGRWPQRCGWTEAAQSVLHGERPASEPDALGRSIAFEALQADAAPALAALLAAGAEPNARPARGCMRSAPLLLNAAHLGHTDCARALLDAGARIDGRSHSGVTALMAAAGQGHLTLVQLLLRRGAELAIRNDVGQTALTVAQARGQPETARALLVAQNSHHLQRSVSAG